MGEVGKILETLLHHYDVQQLGEGCDRGRATSRWRPCRV